MKLRDHPLMTYRTARNWPPDWLEKYADNKTLTGEVGVLTHVALKSAESIGCYLHITHENKPYIGSLLFDDPRFCAFVHDLLIRHLQKSIAEISVLDVSYAV